MRSTSITVLKASAVGEQGELEAHMLAHYLGSFLRLQHALQYSGRLSVMRRTHSTELRNIVANRQYRPVVGSITAVVAAAAIQAAASSGSRHPLRLRGGAAYVSVRANESRPLGPG